METIELCPQTFSFLVRIYSGEKDKPISIECRLHLTEAFVVVIVNFGVFIMVIIFSVLLFPVLHESGEGIYFFVGTGLRERTTVVINRNCAAQNQRAIKERELLSSIQN